MNREEYLSIISKKLKRLPKEEYDKAIDYFNEYFDEAGPENEQQAINDLGDPSCAGDQIIRNIAIKNGTKHSESKSVKGGMSAVWIGILAVFACPVALPLIIAFLVVVFALFVAAVAVLFSVGLAGIVLVLAAPIALIAAGVVFVKSIAASLICLGVAFILIGVGCLLAYGMYVTLVWTIGKLVSVFGKLAKKGGK